MAPNVVDRGRTLSARTVLITGANRGLGLEMVKQLLKLPQPPSAIICTCRQLRRSKELQDIAQTNAAVRIIEFDVTQFDQVPQLVEKVKCIVGEQGLNLLVNNAGVYGYGTEGHMDETPVDGFIEHLNVNVVGPFALVKGLLPMLKLASSHRQEKDLNVNDAAIVNIASTLGSISLATPGLRIPRYAYRTSKAGMVMMTKLMGLDFAQHGIMAVAVCPGWVQTDMGGPEAPLKADESIPKVLRMLANATPEHNGLHLSYDGSVFPW